MVPRSLENYPESPRFERHSARATDQFLRTVSENLPEPRAVPECSIPQLCSNPIESGRDFQGLLDLDLRMPRRRSTSSYVWNPQSAAARGLHRSPSIRPTGAWDLHQFLLDHKVLQWGVIAWLGTGFEASWVAVNNMLKDFWSSTTGMRIWLPGGTRAFNQRLGEWFHFAPTLEMDPQAFLTVSLPSHCKQGSPRPMRTSGGRRSHDLSSGRGRPPRAPGHPARALLAIGAQHSWQSLA